MAWRSSTPTNGVGSDCSFLLSLFEKVVFEVSLGFGSGAIIAVVDLELTPPWPSLAVSVIVKVPAVL